MSQSQVIHESVVIPGPREPLIGTLVYGEAGPCGAVLLAGPHPYMGGTMKNNVVSALVDGLAISGYAALSFDYRAISADTVAESMLAFWKTGRTPQDGELIEEARCARRWLGEQLKTPVHLIGYSFGCEVVSEIADGCTPSLTLIAPTVKHHELNGLSGSVAPKLVLYSNNDFATSQLATESWFASLPRPKARHCFIGVDHFFKGSEDELVRLTSQHLQAAIDTRVAGVRS